MVVQKIEIKNESVIFEMDGSISLILIWVIGRAIVRLLLVIKEESRWLFENVNYLSIAYLIRSRFTSDTDLKCEI